MSNTPEMDAPATKRDLHEVGNELRNELASKSDVQELRDQLARN